MEVVGDSMQPTYMPGDRVIVDLSQNQMTTDTVYAISDGYTEPQIKRLQRVPFSRPSEVKIISDNPALETFTVELDRLTIIGRICGHIARK
jgi:phage repressor protein C with HTH and peptisase S24 domain